MGPVALYCKSVSKQQLPKESILWLNLWKANWTDNSFKLIAKAVHCISIIFGDANELSLFHRDDKQYLHHRCTVKCRLNIGTEHSEQT